MICNDGFPSDNLECPCTLHLGVSVLVHRLGDGGDAGLFACGFVDVVRRGRGDGCSREQDVRKLRIRGRNSVACIERVS